MGTGLTDHEEKLERQRKQQEQARVLKQQMAENEARKARQKAEYEAYFDSSVVIPPAVPAGPQEQPQEEHSWGGSRAADPAAHSPVEQGSRWANKGMGMGLSAEDEERERSAKQRAWQDQARLQAEDAARRKKEEADKQKILDELDDQRVRREQEELAKRHESETQQKPPSPSSAAPTAAAPPVRAGSPPIRGAAPGTEGFSKFSEDSVPPSSAPRHQQGAPRSAQPVQPAPPRSASPPIQSQFTRQHTHPQSPQYAGDAVDYIHQIEQQQQHGKQAIEQSHQAPTSRHTRPSPRQRESVLGQQPLGMDRGNTPCPLESGWQRPQTGAPQPSLEPASPLVRKCREYVSEDAANTSAFSEAYLSDVKFVDQSLNGFSKMLPRDTPDLQHNLIDVQKSLASVSSLLEGDQSLNNISSWQDAGLLDANQSLDSRSTFLFAQAAEKALATAEPSPLEQSLIDATPREHPLISAMQQAPEPIVRPRSSRSRDTWDRPSTMAVNDAVSSPGEEASDDDDELEMLSSILEQERLGSTQLPPDDKTDEPEEWSQQWAEAQYVLRPPINSAQQLTSVTEQVHSAQGVLARLEQLSTACGLSSAQLMRHVSDDTGDGALGGDGVYGYVPDGAAAESIKSLLDPDARVSLGEGVKSLRGLLRIKLADDNDLKTASASVTQMCRFFDRVGSEADKQGVSTYHIFTHIA